MERQPPDEAGRPPPDDGVGSAIHTFLIADVRGYTLFTQERGDEAAAKLAARFAGIARERVEGRGGSVIELRGDEALAVFTSPRQAIRAALDLQEQFMAESTADPDLLLPVGIGLDAGEAVPVETGYRGGALNLAARLCGQAGPGEVLASREVTHLARRMDGVRYEDRGSIQLKGLSEPVPIVRISSETIDTTAPFVGMTRPRDAATAPGAQGVRRKARPGTIMAAAALVLVAAATYAITRPASSVSDDVSACQLATQPLKENGFEAAVHDGLTNAATDLGVTVRTTVSPSESTDRATFRTFIDQGCSVIVALSSNLGQEELVQAAQQHPQQKFVVIDPFEPPQLPNVLGVGFEVNQAAFLAGYIAAGTSRSGVVGTFGGVPVPTVFPFLDGFAAGVFRYNQDNDADVRLVGWNPASGTGSFISQGDFGAFGDVEGGHRLGARLIRQGADIIFPVAGEAGLGAAEAAREAGGTLLIGVDFDQFFQAPQFADLWLTSVRKRYDIAVKNVVELVVDGTFEGGGTFQGNVGNGSVDLAPFHDLEDRVPADLKTRLAELRAGIADGSISVDPRDYVS
jgi:basic membrane protein A and related proteins